MLDDEDNSPAETWKRTTESWNKFLTDRGRTDEEIRQEALSRLSAERLVSFFLGASSTIGFTLLTLHLTGLMHLQPAGIILAVTILVLSLGYVGLKYLEPATIGIVVRALAKTIESVVVAGSVATIGSHITKGSGTRVQSEEDIDVNQRLSRLEREIISHKSDLTDRFAVELRTSVSKGMVEDMHRQILAMERNSLMDARHAMEAFGMTRHRIIEALANLGRRGAINLMIGGFITAAGAIILCYFVLADREKITDPTLYVMHFLPRLAIVTVIQVFALFFLRLYKVGLEEIKFFQNELTTIEQRHLALSVALLQDDFSIRSGILDKIAATDRNNVLEKGQSTIDIERARVDAAGGGLEALKSVLPLLQKGRA